MGSQILICLAGLVTGILVSCGFPEGRLLYWIIPPAAGIASCLLWNPGGLVSGRLPVLSVLLGFSCFFAAGWISVDLTKFEPQTDSRGTVTLVGRVVSYRQVTDKLGQLVVGVTHEYRDTIPVSRHGKLLLTVRPDPTMVFRTGETWEFRNLKVSPVTSIPSKNGFVPSRYWLSRGVRHEARLAGSDARLLKPVTGVNPAEFFTRWQEKLANRIDRIPLSEGSRALVKAMVLGDRSDVSATVMTDFSRAGIIHVLSVSGLHVGIIYFIIAWLLKRIGFLGMRFRSMAALGVVWLYAGVTGFSPSALRSAGMITLFELSRIGRRGTPGLEVLAGTAVIHCLIDPYTVFSAGAQLSYLAVAGIFFWNPLFNPVVVKMNRVGRYFAGTVFISLAAQSLITPLLLFWFGWIPLYFLIGNIFLLPLMVLGFYLGLAIMAMDIAGITIGLLNKGMDLLIGLSMNGAGWLGNLPGNLIQPQGLVWTDVVLYYFLFLSFRFYLQEPHPENVKRMLAGTGILLLVRYAGRWIAT